MEHFEVIDLHVAACLDFSQLDFFGRFAEDVWAVYFGVFSFRRAGALIVDRRFLILVERFANQTYRVVCLLGEVHHI